MFQNTAPLLILYETKRKLLHRSQTLEQHLGLLAQVQDQKQNLVLALKGNNNLVVLPLWGNNQVRFGAWLYVGRENSVIGFTFALRG